MHIKLGFSTCPNDTFMFDALVNQRIDTKGFSFEIIMEDILHLNQRAIKGELDMIKVSYNTYGKVISSYALLTAGSALGHNCGPLLISKYPTIPTSLIQNKSKIAIPGKYTTANLLLGYYAEELDQKQEFLFHEVMPAIQAEKVEAGVIIHENRFTYQKEGLHLIQDLGEFWEKRTKLPIPLGAIIVRQDFDSQIISQLNQLMRESVAFAFAHPTLSQSFVREHAQEMDLEVMKSHIDLYVNEYSLSLGEKGLQAVQQLLAIGEQMGLYPTGTHHNITLAH